MIDDLRRKLVRKASRAVVGGFRPPDLPLASWFGRVGVALPDEDWPMSSGQPMVPLCQLNVTESPFLPERLQGISLLLDAEELPYDAPNGDRWLMVFIAIGPPSALRH